MLKILHQLPPGLLESNATDLHQLLGGPTLVHLSGRRQPALFVSVLLHGNETTGFTALQQLLRRYQQQELPRDLSIFIGNVAAAEQQMRRLDHQPDYNRIWPGGIVTDTPEHQMVQQVFDIMREKSIFASIDIHNNTGLNPHYACINHLQQDFLHLATLFSRTVVYFTRPTGVQSMAFAELGPAVTLECGQIDQLRGVNHAVEFIDACLHLAQLPEHALAEQDIDLFHSVAIVKIPERWRLAIDSRDTDISLAPDLDHLNFRELAPGTVMARVNGVVDNPFDVRDEQGREVSERYFKIKEQQVFTRVPVMPSMLTLDLNIIRQDCLCYLMERIGINYPQPRSANEKSPA